jgi:hypothetical protein
MPPAIGAYAWSGNDAASGSTGAALVIAGPQRQNERSLISGREREAVHRRAAISLGPSLPSSTAAATPDLAALRGPSATTTGVVTRRVILSGQRSPLDSVYKVPFASDLDRRPVTDAVHQADRIPLAGPTPVVA